MASDSWLLLRSSTGLSPLSPNFCEGPAKVGIQQGDRHNLFRTFRYWTPAFAGVDGDPHTLFVPAEPPAKTGPRMIHARTALARRNQPGYSRV